MENYRSRKHCLLLYPLEDETHKKAIEYIKLNYDYALIEHNKDYYKDTGEIKKSHTHVVISFDNAKWNTSVSKELGVEPNYIQNCRNFELALNYLIHYNDNTKHQYSLDEVQGNLKRKLEKIIKNDNKDENEKSLELITYIEEYAGTLRVSEFARYTSNVGYWDVFRRASVIYLKLIEEHNLRYSSTSYNTYYVNFFIFYFYLIYYQLSYLILSFLNL